jgi:hypothetical protein
MPKYIKVQISAKTYWGFNVEFEKERLRGMTNEDIIKEMINHMKTFFYIHNLEELNNGVDKLNLRLPENFDLDMYETIFICDHNHCPCNDN